MTLRLIAVFIVLFVVIGAVFLWRYGFFTPQNTAEHTQLLRSMVGPFAGGTSSGGSAAGSGGTVAVSPQPQETVPPRVIDVLPPMITEELNTSRFLERQIENRILKPKKEAVPAVPVISPPIPEGTAVRGQAPLASFTPDLLAYRDQMIEAGFVASTSFRSLLTARDAQDFIDTLIDYRVSRGEVTQSDGDTFKASLKDAYAAIKNGTYLRR